MLHSASLSSATAAYAYDHRINKRAACSGSILNRHASQGRGIRDEAPEAHHDCESCTLAQQHFCLVQLPAHPLAQPTYQENHAQGVPIASIATATRLGTEPAEGRPRADRR